MRPQATVCCWRKLNPIAPPGEGPTCGVLCRNARHDMALSSRKGARLKVLCGKGQ